MKIKILINLLFLSYLFIGCVKVSNKNPDPTSQIAEGNQNTEDNQNTEASDNNHSNSEVKETLVLTGLIDIKESSDPNHKIIYRTHKIVIEEGVVIRTNGASLLIEADEIEAKNWQIETFSAEDNVKNTANEGNGQNSGSIEIRVTQKASGNWQLFPRGQAGGVGPRGLHAIERSDYRAPAMGAAGDRGEIDYSNSIEPVVTRRGPRPTCGRQAGQGGPGGVGMNGLAGGEGFPGGDSGAVMVYLPKDSQAQVVVHRLTGAGGPGGVGGEGGPGGPGGPGGSEAQIGGRVICQSGPQGTQGPSGQRGPTGNQGKPGNQQVACVQRGDSRVCSDKLN